MKIYQPKLLNSENGFTMMELMITLSVAAILVAVAVPSFTESIKNNRLINKANNIVIAINIARQTAISRSLVTFVCHTNNADTNSPTCDGGTTSGWNTGNLVYSSAARTLVAAERAYISASDYLVNQTALDGGDDITVVSTNATNYVSFRSDGRLFGSDPANPTTITFKVCDDRTGEIGRIVSVSVAGRIHTKNAEGANACA